MLMLFASIAQTVLGGTSKYFEILNLKKESITFRSLYTMKIYIPEPNKDKLVKRNERSADYLQINALLDFENEFIHT